MPFWVEDPAEPASGVNIDSASAYLVTRRDLTGQVTRIVLSWADGDRTFDGFLARQVYARITGNLLKAADEPKEGGRS